jgi:hypothetical protein
MMNEVRNAPRTGSAVVVGDDIACPTGGGRETQRAQRGWKTGTVFKELPLGLEVELEHGARDTQTNVTNDDALITGKIALAHLKEFPDYYTRLSAMEKEADEYWANA